MKPVTGGSQFGALGRYSEAVTRHHCLRRHRLPARPAAQGAPGRRALHRLFARRQTLHFHGDPGNSPLCFLDTALKPGDKTEIRPGSQPLTKVTKQNKPKKLGLFGNVF